jgi:hypothetical protein
MRILTERGFPFQMILLEGIPGLSQPEREYIDGIRYKAAAIGMYLLTGVNISDARTYFLSFYAPPKDGISWIGWAYYPNDPEMEGPILEPLDNLSTMRRRRLPANMTLSWEFTIRIMPNPMPAMEEKTGSREEKTEM